MTTVRFLAGVVLTFAALAPLAIGTDRVRRAALPGWNGLDAALADAVLVLSAVVVVTEALGTVGLLSPAPVAVGLALTGVLAWWGARWWRRARPSDALPVPVDEPGRLPGWARIVSVGGIGLVAASWVARSVQSLRIGMTSIDTLWYHLPIAVRWVQTGRTTGIQYFDQDAFTAFYPANASLFHAVGFLFFRTDLVSTVVNLGWLALALAAAWAAGRGFGVGPASSLGAALVLGTAGMVGSQPGGASDDVVGLALLLVAVAFTLHRRDQPRRLAHLAVVGLALGLCVGTKYTLVVPAVLLSLGLVVTAGRGRRLPATVTLLLSALLTGSYWYVRNAVAVGNPLPSLGGHLGPFSLPSIPTPSSTSTVARFLFDTAAWRDQLLPGLRQSLGPAWPVVLVLAFIGMVAAVLDRREPLVRMLGVVAALSFLAYLVTPEILAPFGKPVYFAPNLRYASPGLILGLVLLPVALRRWAVWVTGALAAALLVTEIDPTSWPTGFDWNTYGPPVRTGDAVWAVAVLLAMALVAAVAAAVWRRAGREPTGPRRQVVRWAVAGSVALVALLALAGVRGEYLHNRYASTVGLTDWLRDQHDQRIVVAGFLSELQYPLAGPDLSNRVQFAGVREPDGGWRLARTCAEWARLLAEGHYDEVLTLPAAHIQAWTTAQPDARRVLDPRLLKAHYYVYHLDRRRTHRTC